MGYVREPRNERVVSGGIFDAREGPVARDDLPVGVAFDESHAR
jgi:hypothetical protein